MKCSGTICKVAVPIGVHLPGASGNPAAVVVVVVVVGLPVVTVDAAADPISVGFRLRC